MLKAISTALFRVIASILLIYAYSSLLFLTASDVVNIQYGGHFQYLTIQGLALAILTLVVSFLRDVFKSFQSFSQIGVVTRYLLLISLPLSVVISLIYWSLVIFLPRLILPITTSESSELFYLPLHLDLALHAFPSIFLSMEFFFFQPKFNKSEVKTAPGVAFGFALWYCLWVEHCANNNDGIFPYPFLTHNNLQGRLVIYICATLLSVIFLRLLNRLHH